MESTCRSFRAGSDPVDVTSFTFAGHDADSFWAFAPDCLADPQLTTFHKALQHATPCQSFEGAILEAKRHGDAAGNATWRAFVTVTESICCGWHEQVPVPSLKVTGLNTWYAPGCDVPSPSAPARHLFPNWRTPSHDPEENEGWGNKKGKGRHYHPKRSARVVYVRGAPDHVQYWCRLRNKTCIVIMLPCGVANAQSLDVVVMRTQRSPPSRGGTAAVATSGRSSPAAIASSRFAYAIAPSTRRRSRESEASSSPSPSSSSAGSPFTPATPEPPSPDFADDNDMRAFLSGELLGHHVDAQAYAAEFHEDQPSPMRVDIVAALGALLLPNGTLAGLPLAELLLGLVEIVNVLEANWQHASTAVLRGSTHAYLWRPLGRDRPPLPADYAYDGEDADDDPNEWGRARMALFLASHGVRWSALAKVMCSEHRISGAWFLAASDALLRRLFGFDDGELADISCAVERFWDVCDADIGSEDDGATATAEPPAPGTSGAVSVSGRLAGLTISAGGARTGPNVPPVAASAAVRAKGKGPASEASDQGYASVSSTRSVGSEAGSVGSVTSGARSGPFVPSLVAGASVKGKGPPSVDSGYGSVASTVSTRSMLSSVGSVTSDYGSAVSSVGDPSWQSSVGSEKSVAPAGPAPRASPLSAPPSGTPRVAPLIPPATARPRSVDVCFVVDATMIDDATATSPEIKNIASALGGIVAALPNARVAAVAYGDFDDVRGTSRVKRTKLDASPDGAVSLLRTVAEDNTSYKRRWFGYDDAEDVAGALHKATKLEWAAEARVLVHVCDGPPHGRDFHDGGKVKPTDFFVDAAHAMMKPNESVFESLKKLASANVSYVLVRAGNSDKLQQTAKMERVFRETYDAALRSGGVSANVTFAALANDLSRNAEATLTDCVLRAVALRR